MDIGNNLVLGTALGYGESELNNFVKSFREFNQRDAVVLIIDRNFHIFEFMEKFQIQTVFFESRFFFDTHINNSRFVRYLEFLLGNIAKYDRVFLSDTRDIVFQGDPFEGVPFDCMYFFSEDDDTTIELDQNFNSPWIKMVFGEEVYEQLKDKRIICAGTTLGSTGNMIKYLSMMVNVFRQLKEKGSRAYRINVDQGIHNYIAHYADRYFRESTIKNNGDIVGTVGLTLGRNPGRIKVIRDNVYVGDSKPAVIHQYDRSPELTKLYHNKYA